MINRKNTRAIGDCSLCILHGKNSKSIVVSYKSVYVNTHTIVIMDLATLQIKYQHERFCLWETKIFGLVNNESCDFITLSKEGMQVEMLSEIERTRVIFDNHSRRHLLYSLTSLDYLKLEPSNCIRFRSYRDNKKEISIQSQYKIEGFSRNEDIFSIVFDILHIRQLLLLQSIFHCENSLQLVDLVQR